MKPKKDDAFFSPWERLWPFAKLGGGGDGVTIKRDEIRSGDVHCSLKAFKQPRLPIRPNKVIPKKNRVSEDPLLQGAFLADLSALSKLKGIGVRVDLGGKLDPALFTWTYDDTSFAYVLMPVRQ